MHKLPWLPGKVDCKIIDVPSPLPDINDIVQSSDQIFMCYSTDMHNMEPLSFSNPEN